MIKVNALIDSIFSPFINWLTTLSTTLAKATLPKGHSIQFGSVFAPIAMISPAWAYLITNIFIMVFIYSIIFIVVNGQGMLTRFKDTIKWW